MCSLLAGYSFGTAALPTTPKDFCKFIWHLIEETDSWQTKELSRFVQHLHLGQVVYISSRLEYTATGPFGSRAKLLILLLLRSACKQSQFNMPPCVPLHLKQHWLCR
jgi:hypothetical protein